MSTTKTNSLTPWQLNNGHGYEAPAYWADELDPYIASNLVRIAELEAQLAFTKEYRCSNCGNGIGGHPAILDANARIAELEAALERMCTLFEQEGPRDAHEWAGAKAARALLAKMEGR